MKINLIVFCLLLLALPIAAQSPVVPLEVAGLRGPVTVRRDGRGIPYLDARNLHDLYLAQGYITASDRLWQMDLARRTGRGELAEVLGRLALEEDKRHRILGFSQVVEATWPLLKPAHSSRSSRRCSAGWASFSRVAIPPPTRSLAACKW